MSLILIMINKSFGYQLLKKTEAFRSLIIPKREYLETDQNDIAWHDWCRRRRYSYRDISWSVVELSNKFWKIKISSIQITMVENLMIIINRYPLSCDIKRKYLKSRQHQHTWKVNFEDYLRNVENFKSIVKDKGILKTETNLVVFHHELFPLDDFWKSFEEFHHVSNVLVMILSYSICTGQIDSIVLWDGMTMGSNMNRIT